MGLLTTTSPSRIRMAICSCSVNIALHRNSLKIAMAYAAGSVCACPLCNSPLFSNAMCRMAVRVRVGVFGHSNAPFRSFLNQPFQSQAFIPRNSASSVCTAGITGS